MATTLPAARIERLTRLLNGATGDHDRAFALWQRDPCPANREALIRTGDAMVTYQGLIDAAVAS